MVTSIQRLAIAEQCMYVRTYVCVCVRMYICMYV